MPSLFSRKRDQKPGHLTHPTHYDETAQKAPGERCHLSLVHATTDGVFVSLVYRWESDLSAQEADRLDTRARAYVACAIYDAAIAASLKCKPGPPHGSRPSWFIAGDATPVTLVSAGFDVSDKTCFMQIGAGTMLRGQPSLIRDATALVSGFEIAFGQITV